MIRDEVDNKNGACPMDIDQLDNEDTNGDWVATNQTMVGKGPDGEETIFSLRRRGGAMRLVPKGKGKGGSSQRDKSQKKGEWDPKGCTLCGRSSHWAKECTAKTDVYGNTPKERPTKSRKPSAPKPSAPTLHPPLPPKKRPY